MASLLSYALTNVSDVKESLGLASSDTTKDNLVTRKINKATLDIENYCGRRFKETTYLQELYNASQINELVLNQRPVTSTQTFSLEARTTGLNADNWETVDPELYFTDPSSGVIYTQFFLSGRWKAFRVTYSAGYSSIPSDLAEACAELAAYYVHYAGGLHVNVQDKQEGSRRIRYLNNTVSFMTIIQSLGIDQTINSYANLPVAGDR